MELLGGFEPPTSSLPSDNDTKLRHTRIFCCASNSPLRIPQFSAVCKSYFEFFSNFFRGFLLTKASAHGNIILAFGTRDAFAHGEMAEWSKAPVLKTGDVKASVGSNPTLSARK